MDGQEGLLAVLEAARDRGFLGPGPVARHVEHAAAFAEAFATAPARLLDLGAGGGVPGLALALRWPTTEVVALDAQLRRTTFLTEAVAELHLGSRVRVVTARAEVAGRDPELRGRFDAVTARSFGPPAVTAECGAAFLQVNGLLVVSEPPEADDARWPAEPLAALGLHDEGVVRAARGTVRRLRLVRPVNDAVPRSDGRPAKRPLF